jgi:hypothetical protein
MVVIGSSSSGFALTVYYVKTIGAVSPLRTATRSVASADIAGNSRVACIAREASAASRLATKGVAQPSRAPAVLNVICNEKCYVRMDEAPEKSRVSTISRG